MDEYSTLVRMPVVGPEPFNTLVAVHESGLGPGTGTGVTWTLMDYGGGWTDVQLVFKTAFVLIGYDPRNATPFMHSTTVTMQHVELGDDAAFQADLNSVVAEFDQDGRWTVTADSVCEVPSGNHITVVPYVSSWVLCYEPPPQRPPWQDDPRFRKFVPGQKGPDVSSILRDPFG